MTYGLQSTEPSPDEVELRGERVGKRLLLPVFAAWRRSYDIARDEWVSGWWALGLGVSIAALGGHGVVLRVTWGWQPTRACRGAAA